MSRPGPIAFLADDVTGASDLAGALVRRGIATELVFGIPRTNAITTDAVVVALRTRSAASAHARAQVRECIGRLQSMGVTRYFLKYCSTFDSTSDGNIGPTADEMLSVLEAKQIVHCPAYPRNGRTVYLGHLFVGTELLSDSGMRNHPVTPMTDSNLVRVLQAQTSSRVDLLGYPTIVAGRSAIAQLLAGLLEENVRHVIADAVDDAHLDILADAVSAHSGVAGGTAFGVAFANRLSAGVRPPSVGPEPAKPPGGWSAVLVGSASTASAEQVKAFGMRSPTLLIPAEEFVKRADIVAFAVNWAKERLSGGPVLIGSQSDPEAVRQAKSQLGAEVASQAVERGLAATALGLVDAGVRRLIVAGGESSGAVAAELGLTETTVGAEIAPGVPWLFSTDPQLAVAFKSGNFGGPSFFRDAFAMLEPNLR